MRLSRIVRIPSYGTDRIRSCLLWLAVLLMASSLSYAQPKDTLYFYNHSKVVGKLLNITLGRIEFDADGIGIVKIKNTNVQSINATSRNFRVETLRGRQLQGHILRSEKPGTVVVHAIVVSEEIRLDSIASLVFYGQTLRNRFRGNVSAGYSYTKSSQIGRMNADGTIQYNTARSQSTLKGDMIVTYDSTDVFVERANLGLGHEQTFAPLWGAIAMVRYQRNIELGLGLRWQEALGIAREFIFGRSQVATLVTALAFNQETNLENVNTAGREVMFQGNYDMFSFVSPNITISLVESAFVSITSQERFRLDGNITLDYEIITDFYINLQMYHNYDSRSPATSEPNTDHGFVAGLRYKF